MVSRAYLDHAATSQMSEGVLDVYVTALSRVGNPASTHGHGQRASDALEAARERVAKSLGCGSAEVVFTTGGTESINLALKGLFWARQKHAARPVVLIAGGEHHATIEAAEWLRDAQGAELVWLPLSSTGELRPKVLSEAIEQAGADRVALVSFLWANNEVGTVQPVAELCSVAESSGIPVHVDAVAALGQVPLDFAASGASLMSVSAHKIGGPVGVGALVVSRSTVIEPLFHGGSQQRGRSGTQDMAGAVAFAAALSESVADDSPAPRQAHTEHLSRLRDRLIEGVQKVDPTAVLRGDETSRLPGNAHFTFPGCQGDSLVYLLDAEGISVSVGSACRAGVAETSHVLLAMGIPEEEAVGALRFTLGATSTETEIDALLEALPTALTRARAAGLS